MKNKGLIKLPCPLQNVMANDGGCATLVDSPLEDAPVIMFWLFKLAMSATDTDISAVRFSGE